MLAVILGIGLGGLFIQIGSMLVGKSRIAAGQREAERLITNAKTESDQIVRAAQLDGRAERERLMEEFKKESAQVRSELKDVEKRLTKREDNLDSKLDTLTTKERHLEKAEGDLEARVVKVGAAEQKAAELVERRGAELVRVSGMTPEEGKRELLSALESQLVHESGQLVARILGEARENAVAKAREITLTAIQRYAADNTCEATVSTVDIPSDDLKGRVIGREGRNIRAFEKATGVDVIVDDTPGVIVVSSFDPVRRAVAYQTLVKLIQDGRIHPGRIEEVAEQTRKEVEHEVVERGKRAALEANVAGLDRKLVDLLGRLHYRTSYGQNVLQHSMEVAYLCQVMADELGLDGRLARRCGLLHDIGKAVDHEIEGGHPQIGADICRRLKEREEVINAVAGHHGDVESTSPYTPLVMAADAISAARPGGRRDSLERYIQRLEQLEGIATAHDGVKQAYAIQAGRELRVIVDANRLDDNSAAMLARDIAHQVESEMTYPGEVKVTVLREMRAVEIAK
ncbi:MAG: ribonuclease Y [Phycisphaerales bacterium]|nr:ribonuclease Y [Phycisphaerales bacterium]